MTGYPQIIVTGDSIAQLSFKVGGYGATLADQFQGKADVVNRGMGGYNSKQLLMKLRSDLVPAMVQEQVVLFLLHIGTNDSAESGFQRVSPPLQGIAHVSRFTLKLQVEIEAYRSNLVAILGHIRKNYPSAGIILLTPSTLDPPAVSAWEDTLQIPNQLRHPRHPCNTIKYVEACLSVGNTLKVSVVNCFDLHQFAVDSGVPIAELYTDGLHYSEKGYSVSIMLTRARKWEG